ncbi:MAG TPA: hypothetical protein VHV10_06485 [Ktedonobacteraceae bacterium]|nr:hypothetical protein [Ktedonobacteraceae bacterium]
MQDVQQAVTIAREEDGMYRLTSCHSQTSILLSAQDLIGLSAIIPNNMADSKPVEKNSVAKVRYTNGSVTSDDKELEKEFSERDCQAMYNFCNLGDVYGVDDFYREYGIEVSLEAIAENYGCTVDDVYKVVETRPWLRTKPNENKAVNMTWWESDHSDPLELVKVFFPNGSVSTETTVKVKRDEKPAWQSFYETASRQEYYDTFGERYEEVIEERATEMARQGGIELTFTETSYSWKPLEIWES